MTASGSAHGFGRTLRRYRETAGLSQEALAEKAGLSARGVSDLERGLVRVPRLDTLSRLAEAMTLSQGDRQALLLASGRTNPVPDPQPVRPKLDLPTYLTGLLGREREQAALRHLLVRDDARLLSLVGPGGVG